MDEKEKWVLYTNEYKALRDELCILTQLRVRNEYLLLLVISTIWGIGIKYSRSFPPWGFLIAFILCYYFWMKEIKWREGIFRIGIYSKKIFDS